MVGPGWISQADKINRLRAGEPLQFGGWPDGGIEPAQVAANRIVKADWIGTLVRGFDRTISQPLRVQNAIITGSLDLSYATLENDVVFMACRFDGPIDFSAATFRKVVCFADCDFVWAATFQGCRVGVSGQGDAIFVGSHFVGDADFHRFDVAGDAHFETNVGRVTRFDGLADFSLARIAGNAMFRGVNFASDAVFERASIAENAIFVPSDLGPVRFSGGANFEDVEIGGNAHFSRVQFEAKTTLNALKVVGDAYFAGAVFVDEARFERLRVEGSAFFTAEDDPVRFLKDVYFQGADVLGDASFSGAQFAGSAEFSRFHVGGSAYFDPLHGGRPVWFGRDVAFSGARIGQTLTLGQVVVSGKAAFVGIDVAQDIVFDGARFSGEFHFERASIHGQASFGQSIGPTTLFLQSARFSDAIIDADLVFYGASFAKAAIFDGIDVQGNAFFGPRPDGEVVRFGGSTSFQVARIQSQAYFTRSRFEGESTFSGAQFDGDAYFEGAQFLGPVKFARTSIGGTLFLLSDLRTEAVTRFFDEVTFGGATIRQDFYAAAVRFGGPVDLSRLEVGGTIAFSMANGILPATFGAPVRCVAVQLHGAAIMSGVTWGGEANFLSARFGAHTFFDQSIFVGPVRFGLARVEGNISFTRTKFYQTADFSSATIEGETHLGGAEFRSDLSLEDARLHFLNWQSGLSVDQLLTPARVQGSLDARGCTYDRFVGPWRDFLSKTLGCDRQSYDQLERAFRRAGDDVTGDEVYMARWDCETEQYRGRNWLGFFLNTLYGWLAGYGARPRRVLPWVLGIVILGGLIFSVPGGIVPIVASGAALPSGTSARPSLLDAFWVSLSQFLPFGVAAGATWRPGDGAGFVATGTSLRILGWALVPLFAAGVAGLLRRVHR